MLPFISPYFGESFNGHSSRPDRPESLGDVNPHSPFPVLFDLFTHLVQRVPGLRAEG